MPQQTVHKVTGANEIASDQRLCVTSCTIPGTSWHMVVVCCNSSQAEGFDVLHVMVREMYTTMVQVEAEITEAKKGEEPPIEDLWNNIYADGLGAQLRPIEIGKPKIQL